MKLVRFGERGQERPGLWLADGCGNDKPGILDIRAQAFDIEDFDARFFTRWGLARVANLTHESKKAIIPADTVRLAPPLPAPGKIICVGKNYADHAAEFDAEVPKAPVLFAKAPSSWIGPHDAILLRPGVTRLDAEAELAVIIGREARNVVESAALSYVAGYTVLNDVTDRDAQRDDKQWFRGKSGDTYCPVGPWWITADEVPDPQALRVFSKLNGTTLQDGHTSRMLFPIARLIAFASASMTLNPGDVISTGTPSGVGFARTPPVLLKNGDVIEVGVEGVGELRSAVRSV